jgi:recombination protein RecA
MKILGIMDNKKQFKKGENNMSETNAGRNKAIAKATDDLEKIGIRSTNYVDMSIEVIPSGIMPLDIATNKAGLPKGRIIELFGYESSGKSVISLLIAAAVQKQGGTVVLIDSENGFSPEWAEQWGVDCEDQTKFIMPQIDCGEDGLEAADKYAAAGVDLIIIDSIASLTPRAVHEGSMEDHHMAVQARMISQAMGKLNTTIKNSGSILLCINQVRANIGVMFGNPEVTPGGKALKFYASLRIKVRKLKYPKEMTKEDGIRINIQCVKNKIAAPFGQAFFDLYFDGRIDQESAVFDIALEKEIITKIGKTYSFDGKESVGFEKFKELLIQDKEMLPKLIKLIKSSKPSAIKIVSKEEELVEAE